jgi:hypothetical protein
MKDPSSYDLTYSPLFARGRVKLGRFVCICLANSCDPASLVHLAACCCYLLGAHSDSSMVTLWSRILQETQIYFLEIYDD